MKITVLQEKLKEGLNIISRISSKSLTLPILNNILISTQKNFLNLSATNLELGVKWWSLAKIDQEGKITIPTQIFNSFIGLLPNKKINLEAKNDVLKIECENYTTQIKGLSADDFPIIPMVQEGEVFFVDNIPFCESLKQVADIPIASLSRVEISGVYFLFQKNQIIMAGTDSFRLGEKKITLENNSNKKIDKEISFILPQKTVKEIINIFSEKEGSLKIYYSPNQVMFEFLMAETAHPQIQLTSRLIEGEYPNYQEVIPNKFTAQLVIPKNEFLNQVKLASFFSGKISEVKIKVDSKEQTVNIFSQNPDLGEYNSSIKGKIKGQDQEVSFNHRFLIEGILNIKSQEVIFELNGQDGPGVLKPLADNSYLYVIMPIKSN